MRRLFEPLGYAVEVDALALDPAFPEWGEGRHVALRLSAEVRLADLLNHLYVLLPVLDDDEHYNVRWETLPAGAVRHPDHRFEWTREQFASWATVVAERHGYADPSQIERLRGRGLGRKRSLALRELGLGVEALERFVRREPLYRVHECVFGVLAMESEPVDPRL